MISFQPMSVVDRIFYLWPSRRKRVNAETKAAIKYLIEHPEAPCMVGNHFIPHGYGDMSICKALFGFDL